MKNPFPQIKRFIGHHAYEIYRKTLLLNLFLYYYAARFFYYSCAILSRVNSLLLKLNHKPGRFQLKTPQFLYSPFVSKYLKRPLGYLMNLFIQGFKATNLHLTRLYWQHLLKDLMFRKSAEMSFKTIKFLLWLNPDLINYKKTVIDEEERKKEEVSLLDIVITKSPMRFDIVRTLIEQYGADFANCDCPIFMHHQCDYLRKYTPGQFWFPFYSNPIYYLAEYVRNLSFNDELRTQYETAKAEFKRIVDYISDQEQPYKKRKTSGKANYLMKGEFPILAYMPDWQMAKFLIDKGASPNLVNPAFENRNVLETLLILREYRRLEFYLENGYTIENLKEKLIANNPLFVTALPLLSPTLTRSFSDLDKAHIITTALYQRQKRSGINFMDEESEDILDKLIYYKREKHPIGFMLKDLLIDLASNSRDIYLMFIWLYLNVSLVCVNEAYNAFKKVTANWEEREPRIFFEAQKLQPWQCLPEGYIPRYNIADLEKDDNSVKKLAYQVLEIPEGAPGPQITRAYQKLVQKWHPDRNKTFAAGAEMACITKARDLLKPS